jgi:WD40 repeat protein
VLFLAVAAATQASCGGKEPQVKEIASISVKGPGKPVLEDLCNDELVLLNTIEFVDGRPSLRLWNIETGRIVLEVPMEVWVKQVSALHDAGLTSESGPFRCLDEGRRVVALQGNYLALIDMRKGREVFRVLPSPDLNDTTSPLENVMWQIAHRTLALSPDHRLVAAAYNWGIKPRVFLYTADLRTVALSWKLPRYIQDICWSPDGQKLAVLYSGGFDASNTFVGADVGFKLTGIPDVQVFDASSGKPLLRFFSGDMEARLAFSPDGTRLYTISLARYNIPTGKEAAIRVFSASEGALLRTISFPRYQLRNGFAVSPDGKLIVADASTPAPAFFLIEIFAERANYRKHARFLIIDAQTGKLLFKHEEETMGEGYGFSPMGFAFSSDGRRLLVDPNFGLFGRYERMDVYSLDALRRALIRRGG